MADGQVRPEHGRRKQMASSRDGVLGSEAKVHAGCGLVGGGSIRERTEEKVHTTSLIVTEREQLAALIRARQ
jgi:hypothetical protein